MRVEPVIGIFQHMEQLSPEAFKAQRMQELQDLAEYRARHLKFVKDWANPEIRAAIQAKHAREVEEAQRIYSANPVVFHVDLDVSPFTVREIKKLAPKKRHWLARLFGRK